MLINYINFLKLHWLLFFNPKTTHNNIIILLNKCSLIWPGIIINMEIRRAHKKVTGKRPRTERKYVKKYMRKPEDEEEPEEDEEEREEGEVSEEPKSALGIKGTPRETIDKAKLAVSEITAQREEPEDIENEGIEPEELEPAEEEEEVEEPVEEAKLPIKPLTNSKELFVNYLPLTATQQQVSYFFKKYGKVESVKLKVKQPYYTN
eukprot:TRINITY_DN60525_c0_g1_i1.p1 TRINITY_DN60525_c0_g1~~TRINITY_DN60525_c0_g1_i1.p1  ORF type:complete len:206 (-),score=36.02 TRINITY_DN60525_c0_g1_i1:223-840(-)